MGLPGMLFCIGWGKKQIKCRWKLFWAQEGKHFGEVCLWTLLKIIIIKKQELSRAEAVVRGKACSAVGFLWAQQMSPTDDICGAFTRQICVGLCQRTKRTHGLSRLYVWLYSTADEVLRASTKKRLMSFQARASCTCTRKSTIYWLRVLTGH